MPGIKRVVVTFGGAAYDATLKLISERWRSHCGANECFIFDEPWLMHQPFYKENQWAWKHPGHGGHKYGFGWYIWKPFVIRHALRFVDPGGMVMWLDADTYPIADCSMLWDACRRGGGIFAFEASGCTNRQWVKRDVWEAVFLERALEVSKQAKGLIDMWPPPDVILDSTHATARFMLFEKGTPRVDDFLADWERLCCIPGLTTRDPSKRPEFPGFEENRGDQSVYSLLCLKYGIPLHREADAFGEASQKDRELYGQIFEQKYCAGDRNNLSGSKYRRGPE